MSGREPLNEPKALFRTASQRVRHAGSGLKPFDSVRPKEQPPICGVTVSSSWHEPVACAYKPDHDGSHSWASIPALPPILPGITKKDAALRIAVVAAEIRLAIDERDEDAPTWADHLDLIAEALHP